MNLDSAWQAIDGALERAIARGDRVVLLITGHHRPGEPPVQRGQDPRCGPRLAGGIAPRRATSPRSAARTGVMAAEAASTSFSGAELSRTFLTPDSLTRVRRRKCPPREAHQAR